MATGWGRNHSASNRLLAVANRDPTQHAMLNSTSNLSQKYRTDAILMQHGLPLTATHASTWLLSSQTEHLCHQRYNAFTWSQHGVSVFHRTRAAVKANVSISGPPLQPTA